MTTRVILDTSVIIGDPHILSVQTPSVVFIVLDSTIGELRSLAARRQEFAKIVDLVHDAAKGGSVVVLGHNPAGGSLELEMVHLSNTLGVPRPVSAIYADSLLVDYARTLGRNDPLGPVVLATEDHALHQLCKNYSEFTVVDSKGLKALLAAATPGTARDGSSAQKVDSDLETKAAKIAELHKRQLFLSIALGVLVTILLGLALLNIRTVNVWGTLVALPLVGLFFYWFRAKRRLDYGIVEILFGLGSAVSVFLPDFTYDNLDSGGAVKLLGGLYIVVRGLDNVGKGLNGTKLESWWKAHFPA